MTSVNAELHDREQDRKPQRSPEQVALLLAWADAIMAIGRMRKLAPAPNNDPDVVEADFDATGAVLRLSNAVEAALAKQVQPLSAHPSTSIKE